MSASAAKQPIAAMGPPTVEVDLSEEGPLGGGLLGVGSSGHVVTVHLEGMRIARIAAVTATPDAALR